MRFFDVKEGRHVIVFGNDLPFLARVVIWSLISFSTAWLLLSYPEVDPFFKLVASIALAFLASLLVVETKIKMDLKHQKVYLTSRGVFRSTQNCFSINDVQLIKSKEISFGSLLHKKITYLLRLKHPARGLDITLAESSTENYLELDSSSLIGALDNELLERIYKTEDDYPAVKQRYI